MEIKNYNSSYLPKSLSFKGYDARELEGLMFTDKSSADAVRKAIKDIDLDIYTPNIASKSIRKEQYEMAKGNKLLWAQDYFTFLNHKAKAILFDNTRDLLKRVLRASSDGVKKDMGFEPIKSASHLRGGNFFVCNNKGKNEILISEDRLIYDEELFKKIFNAEKIHTIPKLDYHLDLFIRPLDEGNVLVADNEMTKAGMKEGIEKIRKYMSKNKIEAQEKQELENVISAIENQLAKLEITEKFAPYKPLENTLKVVEALKNAGYNPIRVPGSYYYLHGLKNKDKEKELWSNFENTVKTLKEMSQNESAKIKNNVNNYIELERLKAKNDKNFAVEPVNFYENNFINAIVTKKDGKLVYITNASLLDKKLGITPEIEAKTGFSTKSMFIESVAPYIDKENIHFIDEKTTEKLFKYTGGIHCTAAEIV